MSAKNEGLKVERWVKEVVGGRLTPASGAFHASLDIRAVTRWGKEFLLEVKYTTKEAYKLSTGLWQKIKDRAEIRMMHPALCIVFKTKFGKKPIIVIRKQDAPADIKVDREEEVKRENARLNLTPIDEIILVKDWFDEDLIIMPLYLWK